MNYAFTAGNKLPSAKDGDTFKYTNFTQKEPHTKIFEGVKGLTFDSCNLTNCDPPEDAVLIYSPRPQRDWCSHLNPKMAERGLIEPCPVNCKHVVDTDTIKVGTETVETIYHYKEKTFN